MKPENLQHGSQGVLSASQYKDLGILGILHCSPEEGYLPRVSVKDPTSMKFIYICGKIPLQLLTKDREWKQGEQQLLSGVRLQIGMNNPSPCRTMWPN